MSDKKIHKLLVIDGQGGRLGKSLIEEIKARMENIEITAVGTNAAATSAMMKAGADFGATGENPVAVCARNADMIIGPIGIVIADSLLGEVSAKMAVAVGKSTAKKILIPINKCDNIVIGMPDISFGKLVEMAVVKVMELLEGF